MTQKNIYLKEKQQQSKKDYNISITASLRVKQYKNEVNLNIKI